MKYLILTLIIIAILGFMIATNPTLDDYSDYIKQEYVNENEEQGEFTKGLKGIFGGIAGDVIASATTRKNYVFFSLYNTDLSSDKYSCVGIFGNFINCTEETE